MGKPSAPTPPDPRDTSSAATGTSVATAIANSGLQNVNRVGPDGSTLTYAQTGEQSFTDPFTGKTYQIPNYTATERLGETAQGIFDANQSAQGNLANTARDQSAFLQQYLGQPFQGDTSEIEKRIFELGSNTLDPKFANQRADLQTQLSNQGIKLGSAAYDRALNEQGQTQNSAYNDLALRGRGQAFGEMQALRNQPINEITALLSGSQVAQPNFGVNTPTGIPTTDNAGLINANFAQQQGNYGQQLNNWNNTVGGLLALAVPSFPTGGPRKTSRRLAKPKTARTSTAIATKEAGRSRWASWRRKLKRNTRTR